MAGPTQTKPAPAAGAQPSLLSRLPASAKIGVGTAILVVGAILYFVLFFSELDSQIASAHDREHTLQMEYDKAKVSREQYQKDLEEKTRKEQLAREQKKVLPDDAETPTFLSTLQGIATVSGITLISWSPLEEAPQEFYAKVPMRLTLSGEVSSSGQVFSRCRSARPHYQ